MQEITFTAYRDKIRGGWVGKCAGGILGAPIEGYKVFRDMTIDDSLFENNFPNDDLDLQILWLDMAKQKGPWVRANDFRDHWQAHVNFPWNEYGIATLNIRQGLDNPDTGRHNNEYWSRSMGSPIRSEIWGMLCPGSPAAAARYARMDSTLDHTDFSVDAEMFFAACVALSFFEDDVARITQQAIAYTDGGAHFAQLYHDVTHWYEHYGEEVTKHKIKSKYGDADFTAAPQNVGLIILALLAFGDSFDNILNSVNYGHDSDCIIATAAALIGIIKGYEAIPPIWKDRIGDSLMVSPEVTGFDIPETVTQLTADTARVGLTFAKHLGDTRISEAESVTPYKIHPSSYHLTSVIKTFPDVVAGEAGRITVSLENLSDEPLTATLRLTSPVFEDQSELTLRVERQSTQSVDVSLVWKNSVLKSVRQRAYTEKNFPYTLEVRANDQTTSSEKGVPFYGSWLLVGPLLPTMKPRCPWTQSTPTTDLLPCLRSLI